jgi:hypothetical protein
MAETSGATSNRKFGYNAGVSTSEVEIRSEDADLTLQTAAVASEIVSSDVNDDGTATGTLTLVSAIATDVAVVNGLTFTGVAGVKTDNTEFSIDTSDTAAAADLVLSINARGAGTTVPTATILASSSAGVVTINSPTVLGNLVDISSPDATITASAATLTDIDAAGAHTVYIEGLDASYNEVTETISLNGQSAVALANSYYRVNRAYITGSGTSLGNQGTITIRKVTGPVTLLEIPIGKGQSQSTSYTVPINKKINIKQFDFAVGSGSNNAVAVQINAWFKLPTDAIWRQILSRIESNGSDHLQFNHDEYEFGAGTDFKVTSIKLAGTGDAIVDVGYSFRIYPA